MRQRANGASVEMRDWGTMYHCRAPFVVQQARVPPTSFLRAKHQHPAALREPTTSERQMERTATSAITYHQQSQRIRARKDGKWIGGKVGSGVDGEPCQALGEVDKWCRRERKKECWRKEEKMGELWLWIAGAEGGSTRTSTPRAWTKGLPFRKRGGEDHIISKFIATATTNLLRGHRAYPPPAYWTTASSDRCPSTSANGQSWEPTAEPAIISLMSQERPGWKAPILDHFLRRSALPMRCGA